MVLLISASNIYLSWSYQQNEIKKYEHDTSLRYLNRFRELAHNPLFQYYFLDFEKGYLTDANHTLDEIEAKAHSFGHGLTEEGFLVENLVLFNSSFTPLISIKNIGCVEGDSLCSSRNTSDLQSEFIREFSTKMGDLKEKIIIDRDKLKIVFPISIGEKDQSVLKGYFVAEFLAPSTELNTRLSDQLVMSIAVFAIQVILLVLVLIYFGRSIAIPFNLLLDQIRAVASGEYQIIRKSSSSDIKEFMEMESALKEVSRIIREKEQSLRSALSDAEEAAVTKMRFLANMSHELRTPMTGILGVSRILRKSKLKDEERKYLDIIIRSGEGLLKILNEVLDLSKIDSSKMQMEVAPFSLKEVVERVLSPFIYITEERGISLYYEQIGDIPDTILGNAQRIGQVLTNLIGNAIKFTSKGFVKLTIALDSASGDNLKILFVIEDSGIGISEDSVTKLFNAFSQADISTTRKYGGTGLGLALSKEFVQLMGGETIDVTSVVGEGTRFNFVIPFKRSKEVLNYSFQLNKKEDNFKTLSLLLAEDDEVNRLVITENLKQLGVTEIDVVVNGQEAVDKIVKEKRQYHAILMDCHMPIKDGYSASKEIISCCPSMMIVALTADAMKENKDRCFQSGMKDFLGKPFVISEFRDLLSRIENRVRDHIDLYLNKAAGQDEVLEKVELNIPTFNPDEFSRELLAVLKLDGCNRIVSKFEISFHDKSSRLQDLYKNESWDELRRDVHSLKGNSGAIRGTNLKTLAEKAQILIDERRYREVEPLLSEIIIEGPKLIEAVKEFLKKQG